jgi:Tfp pilus assembly protein PilX
MKEKNISRHSYQSPQRGAALVTVLFISLLLLTASAAMLTAVGSNSRNTTDVLSETKAFYAAETGIQAAVNVLRNKIENDGTSVTYSEAILSPANMCNWFITACVSGQVPITGTEKYSINVSNPEGGLVSYTTGVRFSVSMASPSTTPTPQAGTQVCIPDCLAANRTTVSFATTSGEPGSPTSPLGQFDVQTSGTGATTGFTNIGVRIDYRIQVGDRAGLASIYGRLSQADATAPVIIEFPSPKFRVLGTVINLCDETSCAGPIILSVPVNGVPKRLLISADTTYIPTPSRLVLTAIGYGPNGAKKTLEAIVRRNVFDGYDMPATMLLIGRHTDAFGGFLYSPGNSNNVSYSGGNCAPICIPPFGVVDETRSFAEENLATILGDPPGTPNPFPSPYPPQPQVVEWENLPSWLRTPTALDVRIDQLRILAQNANRYFISPSGNLSSPGSDGTRLTFCEGSCTVTGTSGVGLLIVTGKLTIVGNFNFAGLILVTGKEGLDRSGGGGQSAGVSGGVIVAPYNLSPYYPESLSTFFLAPQYQISGGGGSFVVQPGTDLNPFIDDTSAVSDLVLGVAEK